MFDSPQYYLDSIPVKYTHMICLFETQYIPQGCIQILMYYTRAAAVFIFPRNVLEEYCLMTLSSVFAVSLINGSDSRSKSGFYKVK